MAAGVAKKLGVSDRPYYTAADIQKLMGVSKTKAYGMIKSIREDLIKEGKLHPSYPAGKAPKAYCKAMFMI